MMKKHILTTALAFTIATTHAALVPQSADGDDGLGVFSSQGGSGGSSGTFVGGSDIGNAWGFFASNGETSQALYDIGGGALTVGQTISFQMDNGFIDSGSTVGWGLQNIANTNNRLEFFFVGGNASYSLSDNAGVSDSGIGFTNTGITFDFTLTGADSYSLDVTPNGSGTTNFAGTLAGTAGTGVDRLRFFNFNAGNTSSHDAFFNNISVVPEPSTYAALGGLLALGIALLRRRRS